MEESAAVTGELFVAIAAGDVEGVRRAIAAGASPDARQSYVVHEKFGDPFEVQETALDAALAGGRERVAIELIALGAEPTVGALCRACSLGAQALVLRMLDAGADVGAMRDGASPLAQAAWGGHLALVHALIARGASLALQGGAALSHAANAGRAEVVAALLALGVPADVPDAHGWTALMTAAWQDQPDVARLLLDAGANGDHRDARGKAVIDWARESRQRSVVALLERGRRWRSIAGREALAVGVRVQLSFVKYAPYTQRADSAVRDRLAVVEARADGAWVVVDETGERHRLRDAALEAEEPDDTRGRWRIDGAIPAYRTGDRLVLAWRYRNQAPGDPPRADRIATVLEERADAVTVRLDDGSTIELHRFGAQADEGDRSAPRWFVTGRLS